MIFQDISFRYKLQRLQKNEDKTIAAYNLEIDKARASKNLDEEQCIASVMFREVDTIQNEIRRLQHGYVTKQADLLLLYYPAFSTKSPDWVRSEIDYSWSLSPEVLTRLGREVRQERRERVELAFLWPSALIGAVGGIVGIVSIFFK